MGLLGGLSFGYIQAIMTAQSQNVAIPGLWEPCCNSHTAHPGDEGRRYERLDHIDDPYSWVLRHHVDSDLGVVDMGCAVRVII